MQRFKHSYCECRLFPDTDQYTYMSMRGNSVIDYFIMSHTLFDSVTDFSVHNLYSCSPHTPIQLNLKTGLWQNRHTSASVTVKKLVWDQTKVTNYKLQLHNNIVSLEQTTNQIVSGDINNGIQSFANTLYDTAFSVFGVARQITTGSPRAIKKQLSLVHP